MELTFTGRGAMLYPNEGNTAAYFEEENTLFLFDCGEDVASKLIRDNKLTKDIEIYLFITHTHSDHIGSLGTLQQYLYWVCNKKLNIVYSKSMGYIKEIKGILKGFGLDAKTYRFVLEDELDNKFSSFKRIRYIQSSHGDVLIDSASLIIETVDGNILYTGDIADNNVIIDFIELSDGKIDKMYIDTSYNDSPVHLSIYKLNKIIPDELKNKVYCMHINDKKLLPIIKDYGFNLVPLGTMDIIDRDIETMDDKELSILKDILEDKLRKIEYRKINQNKD